MEKDEMAKVFSAFLDIQSRYNEALHQFCKCLLEIDVSDNKEA